MKVMWVTIVVIGTLLLVYCAYLAVKGAESSLILWIALSFQLLVLIGVIVGQLFHTVKPKQNKPFKTFLLIWGSLTFLTVLGLWMGR